MSAKALFEAKLVEMFPDIATTGLVTRKQLSATHAELGSSWPSWLMKTNAGHGVYAVDHLASVSPISEPKIKAQASMTKSDSLVPAKDPNYVQFGNHKDVDTIIKSGMFYPCYISGPTGNGKSTMVEQVCAAHKKELVRVNLNAMTDEDQLIGSKTLVDGNVEIVEGPILIAMRTGATMLLDELDAGSANTLLCLQPILEGKPYYFKLKNEIITPAKGFNIFATANTKGKGSDDGRYIGTNILNEAFLERFAVTFNQEYPPARVEAKIVKNLMESLDCFNEQFADSLVKWAEAIRRTFEDGGVDELITTRRLVHIVRAFAIWKDAKKSVELCCNRFDNMTRTAFIDLFEKISTQPDPEIEALFETPAPITNDGSV